MQIDIKLENKSLSSIVKTVEYDCWPFQHNYNNKKQSTIQ